MAREAVTIRRQLAQASPAAYLPDLATSLNNLASRLSEVGEREEALEVAREAVTIRRQLAQANPAAYLPDLAMSLNNLANRLSEVGRAAGGPGGGPRGRHPLPPARPGQPRRLPPRPGHVAEQPGQPLSEVGRAGGGTGGRPARPSPIYRQLAQASPAAYLPDLAGSLNNLASASARSASGRRHWRWPARPSPSAASSPRPAPPPTSPTWPRR